MKKIIVALMVLAVSAFADGIVAGGEVGYAKINSELNTNVGSAKGDTKSKSLTGKLGYQVDDIRVSLYLGTEKYDDDLVVYNEGNLISYGVEADYVQDNLYVGVVLGTGEKDFDGTDIDFNEYGARVGYIHAVDSVNVEAGIQYKVRKYDTYKYGALTLDLEDEVIGLFVGVSFNL